MRGQSQSAGPSGSYQTGYSVAQPQRQGQTPPVQPAQQTTTASASQTGSTAPRGRDQQQGSELRQGRVFTLAARTTPPDRDVRGTFIIRLQIFSRHWIHTRIIGTSFIFAWD